MSIRNTSLNCGYSFGNPATSRTVSSSTRGRLRSLAASVELDHGPAGGSRLNERLGLGQRGHRLVACQTLEPLHEVAGRLEAVPPVHHVDNLRVAVLEHRLAALRISGSMSLRTWFWSG